MYEILPLAAGMVFAVGLTRWGPSDTRPRLLISVLFALAIGVVAASISGELAESWIFIVIDAAAAMAAIIVTTVVLGQLGWRGERR
jgi:hypothetical protein